MFERIWRDPKRYLPILKQFNGVILPDFSVYRDMPLALQLWNIYRSRAIGHWFQTNGIKVIVNIRYGDERTFLRSCDGVSKGCTIAIGTHGALKCSNDKKILAKGLAAVIENLKPCAIVIYGPAPDCIFKKIQRRRDQNSSIQQRNLRVSQSGKIMGAGKHGGFGNTVGSKPRYRLGHNVPESEKTLDMMLNKSFHAYAIAVKYRIHLRGSGKQIEVAFDPNLPLGVAGKTSAKNPFKIVLGPAAFISEEELANTIAHELNHARSFIKGGSAPENTAYLAGDSLASYIRGER